MCSVVFAAAIEFARNNKSNSRVVLVTIYAEPFHLDACWCQWLCADINGRFSWNCKKLNQTMLTEPLEIPTLCKVSWFWIVVIINHLHANPPKNANANEATNEASLALSLCQKNPRNRIALIEKGLRKGSHPELWRSSSMFNKLSESVGHDFAQEKDDGRVGISKKSSQKQIIFSFEWCFLFLLRKKWQMITWSNEAS